MYTPAEDREKNRLLRKTAAHRQELESEFKEITRRTEKFITHALIIGGTVALTYLLVRQLAGDKSKKKTKNKESLPETGQQGEEKSPFSEILTQLGTMLATQATVFLLNLAREKLSAYLHQNSNKQTDEHP
ncbi:MAG: hypothetical protein KatS3mg032_0965 [Cyclobacteriaceae bacterium]|nr:MAG: hypothetical protein KatS3mg032_0965 [Cyclobacteriaceae bacterium]